MNATTDPRARRAPLRRYVVTIRLRVVDVDPYVRVIYYTSRRCTVAPDPDAACAQVLDIERAWQAGVAKAGRGRASEVLGVAYVDQGRSLGGAVA